MFTNFFYKIHTMDQSQPDNDTPLQAIITLQRTYRIGLRKELHQTIFGCTPSEVKKLPKTNSRIKAIIFDIARHHLIVSEKIYHWTTWDNLKSIIQHNAFLGNHLLKNYGISFEPNALGNADIKNGDGNVICFCPYLVEPTILVSPYELNCDRKIRKNLIRLTIDLTKIDCFGKYNQFFKLFDFCAPNFKYTLIISDHLSFSFKKNPCPESHVIVSINFKQNFFHYTIDKKNAISYGNLFSFNVFCLNKFFDIINKDFPFKNELNDYLDKLTDAELRKVLISFGQGLTIFSEYNFNASLTLTDHLITEIYCANSEKSFLLEDLTTEQYRDTFKQLREKGEIQPDVPSLKKCYLTVAPTGNIIRGCLYGFDINYTYYERDLLNPEQDLRSLSAENFANNQYIETRTRMDS
ncbi:MAG TPA: hypothetical protein VJN02_09810, partial [Gammaproteobacteria bacterium]|nr:hypothetical protein [Gammaproteobacteria bacterium]